MIKALLSPGVDGAVHGAEGAAALKQSLLRCGVKQPEGEQHMSLIYFLQL